MFLETILEIVKITLPAIVVFATAYYLIKSFFNKEYQVRMLDMKQNRQNATVPLRLQAYERLSLYCERISIPNLILRLRAKETTTAELRLALLIAIQQEYEHNVTQQVYVSPTLWQIIKLARNTTVDVINEVASRMTADSDSLEFSRELLVRVEELQVTPTDKALAAIKKEAAILL